MRTAMVWGGSGDIGTALVERLIDAAWTVVSMARDPGAATGLASEVVKADVTDASGVEWAAQQARESAGDVDLWIYAVGDIASVKVDDMPADDWDRILGANLRGAYLAAHYSLPLLASDAHMFFLGAVSERLHLPGLAAYAAAKAGLEAFADVLRKEQRYRRVTIVRPRAVDTRLWAKVPFSLPRGALAPGGVADRILQAYEDGHSGVLDM